MRAIWTRLELKVPPLLVLLLTGAGMYLVTWMATRCEFAVPGGRATGFSVALLGMAICASGVYSFRTHRTTVDPTRPEAATHLVVSGVYRFTRNPMYLGFAALLLGWGLLLGDVLAILGVPAFVLYLSRFQIYPEERALRQKFGGEFDAYARRVRRWV